MRVARQRRIAVLMALAALWGCAAIPKAPQRTPIKASRDPKSVMLDKVVARPQRGAKLGTLYGGAFKLPQTNLIWKGGRVSFDPTEFAEELQSQLEAYGYKVLGDPDALFEDESRWQAEYLIGALIKEVKLDLWYPWCGYGNYNTGSGDGYVEVNWQIYSRRSRNVVLTTITRGSAHKVKVTDLGPDEPLLRAFGAAARNLMANREFVDLVCPRPGAAKKEELAAIKVNLILQPRPADSPEAVIDRARKSVVTIFAGDGHGSGFIISADGYVLTNQHVVGTSRSVTARTISGREVLGEVVRVNRERDVALVKLEPDIYEPLALSESSDVRPGSEVYAIGAPLDERLSHTVSRGIVSGFRAIDETRFIQSDVAINPGNSGGPLLQKDGSVVGIAVSGIPTAEGINFFVPIELAAECLNICPAD